MEAREEFYEWDLWVCLDVGDGGGEGEGVVGKEFKGWRDVWEEEEEEVDDGEEGKEDDDDEDEQDDDENEEEENEETDDDDDEHMEVDEEIARRLERQRIG